MAMVVAHQHHQQPALRLFTSATLNSRPFVREAEANCGRGRRWHRSGRNPSVRHEQSYFLLLLPFRLLLHLRLPLFLLRCPGTFFL